MEKYPLIKFSFLITVLFLVLTYPSYAKNKSDSLVVAISSKVLSLDPTNHRDRETQVVIKNIFDSLTTRDNHLLVVPQLASSWKVINDTLWEFNLRKGVKFHNGESFTAEDVKFTLDRVTKEGGIDGRTSPRKSLLGKISKVTIIDSYTIRIETDKPWPILPLMLTLQEIVPKKYIKSKGSEGFEKFPVGTGPFKFIKKDKDNSIILKRFEDYYGGSPENPPVQKASLKNLTFKFIPHQAKRIAMLKKEEADIVSNIPFEAIPLLEILPDILVMSQPATRSFFAELNCSKPPLNNLNVRLALNYAIDMRGMVNRMYHGRANVLPTILLYQAFGFNENLMPYPYDPQRAKELLKESGFSKKYTFKIVSIEKYSDFANNISFYLSKSGLRSRVLIKDKKYVRNAMQKNKADILVTSWGNTTLDPIGILVPKFKSDGRGNFSNYSNKDVDNFLLSAESSFDSQERAGFYKKVQDIIYRDAPMIFGYSGEEFFGVNKRVKGFHPSATGMLNLHDVSAE